MKYILNQVYQTLWVTQTIAPYSADIARVATKWFFCDFAKYEIGRNKILISRYFAKFRKMILPKFRETSRNTFSISRNMTWRKSEREERTYECTRKRSVQSGDLQLQTMDLFRKLILPKFRKTSQNTVSISRDIIVLLVSRKKFRAILSNTYFAKWFCRNFAKFRETLFVFREISSFH